jgi:hypothetical protein
MEKYYDNVEHGVLDLQLQEMGVPKIVRDHLFTLYKSASYVIRLLDKDDIKYTNSKSFHRAIIQGFHTSCLLCAIINEPAARIQEELKMGYHIGNLKEALLSALFYFDDHNLFQKNRADIRKAIVEHMTFMQSINQRVGTDPSKPSPFIHLLKREVTLNGKKIREYGPSKENMVIELKGEEFTFSPLQWGEKLRYLGVHAALNKAQAISFKPMEDHIQKVFVNRIEKLAMKDWGYQFKNQAFQEHVYPVATWSMFLTVYKQGMNEALNKIGRKNIRAALNLKRDQLPNLVVHGPYDRQGLNVPNLHEENRKYATLGHLAQALSPSVMQRAAVGEKIAIIKKKV